MADDLVMTAAQATRLRSAAAVLRDLWEDGFIDFRIDGPINLDTLAGELDTIVTTYAEVMKKNG